MLVTPDGSVVGALPPILVALPWWAETTSVVEAVRERDGIDVVILRLLETEVAEQPGGLVTYLAEIDQPVVAEAWNGRLDDHPLRQTYARPGGPAADLAWASGVMGDAGIVPTGPPTQVKTWNLSSLWRIPAKGGDIWLKCVPPFFAHEGAILELLRGEPVPPLIGRDDGRALIGAIDGDDLFEATEGQRLAMVRMLVGLQEKWIGRTDALFAIGLPDWRERALTEKIADVASRTELDPRVRATIESFVADLPRRYWALALCGLEDTLVHGDFHSGNVRGGDDQLTILDWGDSGVGHPLLDQPAFLERLPEAVRPVVEEHWIAEWRRAVPASDPRRAAALLAPIAAARQAVIYRMFLDNIEPSERVYHASDPALWLNRTAELVRAGAS